MITGFSALFKNLPEQHRFNEWYLRDQSRKVAAAYKMKGTTGKPTTHNAIYGYKKDPKNKDHWLIDDEAAVVRRIFRLAIEGHDLTTSPVC